MIIIADDVIVCLHVQVNIWVPQPEKQLDVIKVTGLAANVERAKQGLLERVRELQAEQEDRVRRHSWHLLFSALWLFINVSFLDMLVKD